MTQIERCLAQLDRIAEVIEDALGDDDSVQWAAQIREVAVEIARLARQPAGAVGALDEMAAYAGTLPGALAMRGHARDALVKLGVHPADHWGQ